MIRCGPDHDELYRRVGEDREPDDSGSLWRLVSESMGGWRAVGAAIAGFVLAAVPVPLPVGAQPADVPCPVAEIDPPERPAQPEPPPHGPGDREVGGPLLATAGLVVPPGAPRVPGAELSASSWLVADLDTGMVLGGCGPHEYGIPASTLKLLLAAALLAELDPDEEVEVVREDLDIEPGSSAVGLVVGGAYPVEKLWLGLLLNSGNDAANVLARLGGGEDGLAGGLRAMNEEAQRLGAFQTHAATPSGLDGPGQFTSAYDLALIARKLFDREDFQRYIATERTSIPAQPQADTGGFQIQNQNDLLGNYSGALGGKTGFTDLARHSFVGAAERDGRRLVVTLLGAENQPGRSWEQAAALLDWGFSVPRGDDVGRLVEPGELQELAVSSTQAPVTPSTSPAPASQAAAADQADSPVNAVMVGTAILVVGVFGLVALAVVSRRRT
jgi:serine-type D-Ala-D-Ala carboxypeptidase (penicillin-binding protein 5/6)